MTATKEEIETVAKLISASRIALLTTTNSDGQLVSRPLAVQEAEFDGTLWFFSQDPSDKTEEIKASEQVNVSLESGKGYLSIAGAASVVRDEAKIEELWSKRVEAWFPEGREDPTISLIRVDAATAEYWAVNEPKAVVMLKVAKAAVTGGQPDVGDNRTIDL
jgi:general stress protein 26